MYRCSLCGSTNVRQQLPCFVNPNDIDDRSQWEIDGEADYLYSGSAYCEHCEEAAELTGAEGDTEGDK